MSVNVSRVFYRYSVSSVEAEWLWSLASFPILQLYSALLEPFLVQDFLHIARLHLEAVGDSVRRDTSTR